MYSTFSASFSVSVKQALLIDEWISLNIYNMGFVFPKRRRGTMKRGFLFTAGRTPPIIDDLLGGIVPLALRVATSW